MGALDAQTVTVPAEATIGRVIAELVVELDRASPGAPLSPARSRRPSSPTLSVSCCRPCRGSVRTGSRILAEIGDGSRFANGDKLASYAGLAPVTRQSGKSINGESQSRRGNHRLKNAMFLAAFASLRASDSKAFYDRKRAEGKRHDAAVICLARPLQCHPGHARHPIALPVQAHPTRPGPSRLSPVTPGKKSPPTP
jgi:Transposase IS116/IS110/IS902 family